jgi:hypothetical protein
MKNFVGRSTSAPFRHLMGDMRKGLMQRLLVALHAALGLYHRDAVQERCADSTTGFPAQRAYAR